MNHATFHFHGQLNFFLPNDRQEVDFGHAFEEKPTVKDMIESLGVPHAEIQRIIVNGKPVAFDYRMKDADRVEVFPTLPTDQAGESGTQLKFVLDVHLGRLAAYLRLLGFDTLYRNDYDDPELAKISSAEDRVLLTRDLGLLKRSLVNRGYFVRNTTPAQQLGEIIRQFRLTESKRLFHRSLNCNGILQRVKKEAIADRLWPRTQEFYDEFHLCPSCGNIYWKGSHYERMQKFVDAVLVENGLTGMKGKTMELNEEVSSVKNAIDSVTTEFFKAVSFKEGEKPAYQALYKLFIDSGQLIKNSAAVPEITTVSQFIEPRQRMVDSGELISFREAETAEITEIFGNIAHRFSTYEKHGLNKGGEFEGRGIISTQFIKTEAGWKMSSMAWDDERPGLTIPDQYK